MPQTTSSMPAQRFMMVVRLGLKNTFSLAAPHAFSNSSVNVVPRIIAKNTIVFTFLPPMLPATTATAENQKIHTKGFNRLMTKPLPSIRSHEGLSSFFSRISLVRFSISDSFSSTFRRKVKMPNSTSMTPAPMLNNVTSSS